MNLVLKQPKIASSLAWLLKLVVVGFLLVTVTGCVAQPPSSNDSNNGTNTGNNNSGNDDTDDDDDNATNDVTLKWWGAYLKPEDVKPLIDKFEFANPGIKINYETLLNTSRTADIQSYRDKVDDIVPDASNPNAPDIFTIDSGWLGSYIPYIESAPSDVISAADFQSKFYDFVTTEMVRGEKVYGAPLWVDTLALIYNKSMWQAESLTEPDSDWNRFANNQAKKLTKTTGTTITQAGFSAGNTDNTEFWFEALNMLLLQNGVNMLDANGKAVFASDSDAAPAVSFYKQFNSTNKTWNDTFNLDAAAFLEKKLATYMAPSWRLNDIVRFNTIARRNISIGISELPQLKSVVTEKVNFGFFWTNVVNNQSKQKAAAWKFLNYITQPEQLELLNDTVKVNKSSEVGLLYPRVDMNSKQLADKYLGAYASGLKYAKSWFMVDELEIRSAFAGILDNNSDLNGVQTEVNATLAKLKE